jgi:hypothetical protein
MEVPESIKDSLDRYKNEFKGIKTCFIAMHFGYTGKQELILDVIKSTLELYDIIGLRADEKEFHQDLLQNVETYIFGCDFSIAVYERFLRKNFNPNVSFEIGYLLALRKPIYILKDKSLPYLPVDIVGKLSHEFDSNDPESTISEELVKWMMDRKIIKKTKIISQEYKKPKSKYHFVVPRDNYDIIDERIKQRLLKGLKIQDICDELDIDDKKRVSDELRLMKSQGLL